MTQFAHFFFSTTAKMQRTGKQAHRHLAGDHQLLACAVGSIRPVRPGRDDRPLEAGENTTHPGRSSGGGNPPADAGDGLWGSSRK